jgi:hypothetical protein
LPQVPQFVVLVCRSAQAPEQQASPDPQATPHPPQFAGSLPLVSMQVPVVEVPQQESSAEHAGLQNVPQPALDWTHPPLQHWSPVSQTLPQAPQLVLLAEVLWQTPLQHWSPERHALPHLPQSVFEVLRFWQPSVQAVSLGVQTQEDPVTHLPLQQVSPVWQAFPQVPQLGAGRPALRFAQVPLQQTSPFGQALPHAPQLLGSLPFTLTQAPLQSVVGALQVHAVPG